MASNPRRLVTSKAEDLYEACPESKDTKVLNMYYAFSVYKSDTVNELPVHNFIFQHSRRHCPNIY